MADVTIRKMIDDDLDVIEELEKVSLKAPWNKKVLTSELHENPCSVILVAEVEGKIAGYLDFMITFDSATISRIAVFPEFRRLGIATCLLDEMNSICKNQDEPVAWITLEVRPTNVNAVNLYLSSGYEKVTIKKAYYDDGEDAIYMMRSLV
ncbi:MAG: ribosomal protein S18-alanine N-acetyltransferase [Bacilli bacterium]|nr:ribosomal protein S18-alanine N-acetyltransferase [Bacilli bacterium]